MNVNLGRLLGDVLVVSKNRKTVFLPNFSFQIPEPAGGHGLNLTRFNNFRACREARHADSIQGPAIRTIPAHKKPIYPMIFIYRALSALFHPPNLKPGSL